jgi:hypothetical protein
VHSHNGARSKTNAASTGNGGNGSRIVAKTEPTELVPNQGVQDNPPPPDINVNSQVPHVVVPTVNNTSREENVPINEMHTEDV